MTFFKILLQSQNFGFFKKKIQLFGHITLKKKKKKKDFHLKKIYFKLEKKQGVIC